MRKGNLQYLILAILIFTISIASFTGITSRGIFNPKDDKLDLNNPIAIYLPSNFHVWENRLYFYMYDSLYQYDISDRINIAYKNNLYIDYSISEVVYFEDNVYTYYVAPTSSPENYTLILVRYTLDENLGFIEKKTFQGQINESYVFITNFLSETVAVINTDLVLATSSGENSTLGGIIEEINEDLLVGDLSYLKNLQGSHYEDSYGYLLAKKEELVTYFGVFDFTNYTNPTKLGNCTVSCNADKVTGLAKKDNIVYIETANSTAIAINVTDKANPIELATFSVSLQNANVKIHNHFVFVTSFSKYLTIYDISQISDPIELGYLQTDSIIDEISVFDELLIITELISVGFYDWSNPISITKLNISLPTSSSFNFKAYLIIGIVCTISVTINKIFLRKKIRILTRKNKG